MTSGHSQPLLVDRCVTLISMESESVPPKTLDTRHKCSACYKQFKRKEHLIEHMKISYHSVHQPRCGVCQKHCKSFESLREHLAGPLAKSNCSRIFSDRGCNLCLKVFDSPNSLDEHKESCLLSAPAHNAEMLLPYYQKEKMALPNSDSCTDNSGETVQNHTIELEAVAMDCEMVGGGSDGSIDLCARVCIIDEQENVIFHAYVQPQVPVTNYRYEVTGLTEAHLRDAIPLIEVHDKIMTILCNGESVTKVKLDGGKARVLVGHGLEHDLESLRINYPNYLLRDTAKFLPLMRTNLVSHSLKYLTRTYLGYDIQMGVHDPYEDCVSAMRLYKRMRNQYHVVNGIQKVTSSTNPWKSKELEKMTPDELLDISVPNYRCWCLDSGQVTRS